MTQVTPQGPLPSPWNVAKGPPKMQPGSSYQASCKWVRRPGRQLKMPKAIANLMCWLHYERKKRNHGKQYRGL